MFVITDVRPSEAETRPTADYCAVHDCSALSEDNLPSLEEWLFDGCGVEAKVGTGEVPIERWATVLLP